LTAGVVGHAVHQALAGVGHVNQPWFACCAERGSRRVWWMLDRERHVEYAAVVLPIELGRVDDVAAGA
jgi:hypothetical protein